MEIVGLGEYRAARRPGKGLKTFALGSCVAIILYDDASKAAAMAHVALPDSTLDYARACNMPAYFADTAVPALLEAFKKMHSGWLPTDLRARLVGGASILQSHSAFQIGKRNVAAARKTLARHGVNLQDEDVGGSISRTVSVSLETGSVCVFSPGRPMREL